MIVIIIQYNYERGYENIEIALKIALNIEIEIVMLQELFINSWKLSHNMCNLYWP